jgi:DNA-directed RNA polymerase specialized sigma24 family protein
VILASNNEHLEAGTCRRNEQLEAGACPQGQRASTAVPSAWTTPYHAEWQPSQVLDRRRRRRGPKVRQERGRAAWINRAKRTTRPGRSTPPRGARAAQSLVGLDVARVAAITGKRPGAVRVFTHRGLRRLAERLGADFPVRGNVASARGAYPTIASKT